MIKINFNWITKFGTYKETVEHKTGLKLTKETNTEILLMWL